MSGKHEQLHRLGDSASWRCFHCTKRVQCRACNPSARIRNMATRDHLIARSLGGGGGANIVLSCQACNQAKGDRPLSAPPRAKKAGCRAKNRGSARQSFATREQAEVMCAAVFASHGRAVEAYLCDQCDTFHIGKSLAMEART